MLSRLLLLLVTTMSATTAASASTSFPLTRISAYSAHASQTDSTPRLSACGRTRPGQIGVSRDLLKIFPCGTMVKVTLANGRTFVGPVWDSMAPRWYRAVDVLVPTRNEAIRLGVSTGRIEKLR